MSRLFLCLILNSKIFFRVWRNGSLLNIPGGFKIPKIFKRH